MGSQRVEHNSATTTNIKIESVSWRIIRASRFEQSCQVKHEQYIKKLQYNYLNIPQEKKRESDLRIQSGRKH